MSAELWNRIKHQQQQITHLQSQLDALADRLLSVEAEEPTVIVPLDALAEVAVKRGPGRPRKVVNGET